MARRKKTFDDYLKAAIREIWGWSEERRQARKLAQRANGYFLCAHCKNVFERGETQVDHIVECEALDGWDGWSNYITRVRCPVEGLQVLCKGCHSVKSKGANAKRRAARKLLKGKS